MSFPLPSNLVATAQREGHGWWLKTLPSAVEEVRRRWDLTIGPPFQPGGQTAWVAPAGRTDVLDLVVKMGWPHYEARDQAVGLALWAGQGAVRIHEVAESESHTALLLERCVPGTPLSVRPEFEQDKVIAGLLERLWQPPPEDHRLRPLQSMCEAWAAEFERRTSGSDRSTADAALVRDGVALFRRLSDTPDHPVMLATDLHAGNVLAATREPWLIIDPKPYVGDRTYDVLQHLLNVERLTEDPADLCARMAGLCGLEVDRVTQWLLARCVIESEHQPELLAVARRLAAC